LARASTKEAREDRRHKTLELRLAGHGIRAIARKQGIAVGTVCADLDLMLGQLADQHAAEVSRLRSIQTRRYEKLLSKVWPKAKAGALPSVDRCVSLLARIDRINGLDDGKSLAIWIQSQTEVRIGIGEDVPAERLKEYADVIRGLVAAQDVPAEADPQASNGHRECLTL